MTRHNVPVRRVLLLAIGLIALLCASTAPRGPAHPNAITTISGVAVAAEPQGSRESNQQWHPHRQTIAAVTESVWKSAPVHAALAATRSACVLETALTGTATHSPVRSAPPYLRHTPLLI
jgi:hypothetical protein